METPKPSDVPSQTMEEIVDADTHSADSLPKSSHEDESSDQNMYKYDNLPSTTHIRLLTIHPEQHEDPGLVQCSLAQYPLDDHPDYTAVSYSWGMNDDGDALLCRVIWIDGRSLQVTRNLYEGMLRFRGHVLLPLWVDAVCINQQDLVERSHQVARMADIYRSAKSTVVWLGEGKSEEDDRSACEILKRLQNYNPSFEGPDLNKELEPLLRSISHGSQQGWCWGETVEDFEKCALLSQLPTLVCNSSGFSEIATSVLEQKEIFGRIQDGLTSLSSLFERRYWGRRWIIQEFAFSQGLEILFGPCILNEESFSWYNVSCFAMLLGHLQTSHHQLQDTSEVKAVEAVRRSREWESQMQKRTLSSLIEALEEFARWKCLDPRDMLYTLFAFAPDMKMRVDYTISPCRTYIDFTRMLLEDRAIDLVLVHLRDVRQEDDDLSRSLPSWVPDYRMVPSPLMHHVLDGGPLSQRMNSPILSVTFNPDGASLNCTVYVLGSIILPAMEESFDRSRGIGRLVTILDLTGARMEIEIWPPRFDKSPRLPSGAIHGDILCATSFVDPRALVILRRDQSNGTTYKLVRCLMLRYWQFRTETAEFRAGCVDHLKKEKLAVNIV